MHQEQQYLKLLNKVLKLKKKSSNRTDVDCYSAFGAQMQFDLSKGFPLITTKKVHWKSLVVELLWLMKGDTNITFLKKHDVRIWDEWADKDGNLGPVYGKQWRKWEDFKVVPFGPTDSKYSSFENRGVVVENETSHNIMYREIDQLTNVIEGIKANPTCRRLIISAWNVGDVPDMKLPPCHSFFQFNVSNGKLDLQLYQRSADMFLGVPFNIASYSLLVHLIANECGLEVGSFIHTLGNYHLYENHREQAGEQLTRTPMEFPSLKINLKPGELMNFIDHQISNLSWEEIKKVIVLSNYKSHEKIEGKVAV